MQPYTHIHLVRHGHVHNPKQVFYGRLPRFRLSAKGIRQAREAARFLGDKPLSALYSSPLLRARQTACEMLAATGCCKVRISRLINEIRSPLEGRPWARIDVSATDMYADVSGTFETPRDVVERTSRFFRRIVKAFEGRRVAAVTHGDVIVFAFLWANGYPLDPAYKGRLNRMGISRGYPAHGSVTTFRFEGGSAEAKPAASYWEVDRET
jgi:probable phosphoglycerate mutase